MTGYAFLREYVKAFPQWIVDVSGMICNLPINAG
jgi:hypothetical protein